MALIPSLFRGGKLSRSAFLAALVLVGLGGAVLAQDQPQQDAPSKTPAPAGPMPGVDNHLGVTYATVNGTPLLLDIYVPTAAAKPLPVIVWIHGGGWSGGSRVAPWLKPASRWVLPITQAGFALVSVDYRLSTVAKFPAQIYDCKAAIRWVRAHATDYGFNPDKIGVWGSSAGGHLVALIGTTNDDPALEGDEGNVGVSSRVQAVVDFFGPTDFLNFPLPQDPAQRKKTQSVIGMFTRLLGGPVDQNRDEARLASPIYHVAPKAPPFFIMHGDADSMVPIQQSIELNDALQKAGVPSSLYVVKGGPHGVRDPVAFQKGIDFCKQYLQVH